MESTVTCGTWRCYVLCIIHPSYGGSKQIVFRDPTDKIDIQRTGHYKTKSFILTFYINFFYLFGQKDQFSGGDSVFKTYKALCPHGYHAIVCKLLQVAFVIHGFTQSSTEPWVLRMVEELLTVVSASTRNTLGSLERR